LTDHNGISGKSITDRVFVKHSAVGAGIEDGHKKAPDMPFSAVFVTFFRVKIVCTDFLLFQIVGCQGYRHQIILIFVIKTAIHANSYFVFLQNVSEGSTGELSPLVGVKDLWFSIPAQGLFEGLNAKV